MTNCSVCRQAKYNKRYASPEEEKMREVIFEDNIKMIVSHNNEFEAGIISYEVDVNKFTDLTSDEFLNLHTGLKRDARSSAGHSSMNVFMPSPMLDMMVEDEVDWRKKGAVTPVKNQGNKSVLKVLSKPTASLSIVSDFK
jgi:cathepsin L